MTACAYRPIAIDREQLFIGAFKSKKDNDGLCLYNEIEGIGLKLGWTIIGFGYFDRKVLTVLGHDDGVCSNDFATIHLNECALENKCVSN